MNSLYILFFACLSTAFAKNIAPEVSGSSGGAGVAESVGTATASDPNGAATVSISSGVSAGGSGSVNNWETSDPAANVNSQGSGSTGSGYGNAYGTIAGSGAEVTGTIENAGYGIGLGQGVPSLPAKPAAGQRQGRWWYPSYYGYGGYYGGYNPYYYGYGKR